MTSHLDAVADAYRSARDEARRRPTWRLRYNARRWRRARTDRLDDIGLARLAALRRELRSRAEADLPSARGLP